MQHNATLQMAYVKIMSTLGLYVSHMCILVMSSFVRKCLYMLNLLLTCYFLESLLIQLYCSNVYRYQSKTQSFFLHSSHYL